MTAGFYLMNFKGFHVLKALISSFDASFIEGVVTSRDPNTKDDYSDQIISTCKNAGINVFLRREPHELHSSFLFAIGWRWLISTSEDQKLIVLHDSILPKNRGFNPLVTNLINGDKEIGVTAFLSSPKYDCGPIIGQKMFSISYPLKIKQAIEIVSKGYVSLVCDISTDIRNNRQLTEVIQDESKATYSLWRDEKDYRVDWNKSAEEIMRFVNAVGFPYQGASSEVDGKLIRIVEVETLEDIIIENRVSGKVIFMENGKPVVVCGKGLIKINQMHDDKGENYQLKKSRIRFE
jgi:methionyl-tRNA formyltransferase